MTHYLTWLLTSIHW